VAPKSEHSRSTQEGRRLGRKRGQALLGANGVASGDPVEEWKQSVRASLSSGRHTPGQSVVHVEMKVGFVVVTALIGSARSSNGVISTLVALSSAVFVHELSRAFLARSLERSSEICMSTAGGDTKLSGPPLRGFRALLFTVMGSIANGLLALGALSIVHHGVGADAAPVLHLFAVTHGAWGIAQLLPFTPFHVGAAISQRLAPATRFAHAAASAVSVFTIAILAVSRGYLPPFVGLAVFAATAGIRALRDAYREMLDFHAGLAAVLRDARLALSEGQPARAFEISGRGLAKALSVHYREELWKAAAWAAIGKADPLLAHDALLRLPRGAVDLHLLVSYLGCCNRIDEAIELLQQARLGGQSTVECTKLLADLLFRRGDGEAVLALARSEDSALSTEDRNAIETAVASLQSA
jgi:hypothetical protein